jgi:hypothetical protein
MYIINLFITWYEKLKTTTTYFIFILICCWHLEYLVKP